MTKKHILDRIKKLNKELSKEVSKLEQNGYCVVVVYNEKTNKDELVLVKQPPHSLVIT